MEDTHEQLMAEVRQLRIEKSKLARELRVTKDFLEKVKHTVEAKEALGAVLSAANAKHKAYTEMLLEYCPNIILLMDGQKRLVLSTKVFLSLTGFHNFDLIRDRTFEEVLGRYFEPGAYGRIDEAIGLAARTGEMQVISEWIDFGGKGDPRCYSIELSGIGGDKGQDAGIGDGILAVFVDLTDVMHEKQRAEDANRAKSDFLATMSHEIRTPMNAIIGLTEMLRRSEPTPVQAKYITDIVSSAGSLLSIINDILDLSKIEAGRFDIVKTDYNLRALLENLRSIFALMFTDKGLVLHFEIGDSLPEMVHGDENRLRQILTNILSNAMKYTAKGYARFTAWFEEADRTLRFDVQDTGIGIRAEDVPKLFMPFEQFEKARNRNIVGTGLGLAISYRLCRLMNGDLSLQSEYGAGSTFSVSLPYEPAALNASDVGEDEPADFTAPDASVLVVDDIEINLTVAEALLGTFEIRPVLALSGAEAAELAGRKHFDIVFMDHMMPGMDGIEATKQIRKLGGHLKELPIIALTANALSGMEEMYLSHGLSGFLPKPLELPALNRCLRKWLPAPLLIEADEE